MVEKPAYCTSCRHTFEYDTDAAESNGLWYILACPKCGGQNNVMRTEVGIVLLSIGTFIGMFLGWYFIGHDSLRSSIFVSLIVAAGGGLASYYLRVRRLRAS